MEGGAREAESGGGVREGRRRGTEADREFVFCSDWSGGASVCSHPRVRSHGYVSALSFVIFTLPK